MFGGACAGAGEDTQQLTKTTNDSMRNTVAMDTG
jgi:hypothetical protein